MRLSESTGIILSAVFKSLSAQLMPLWLPLWPCAPVAFENTDIDSLPLLADLQIRVSNLKLPCDQLFSMNAGGQRGHWGQFICCAPLRKRYISIDAIVC